MNYTFLDDDQAQIHTGKGSFKMFQLKIQHLNQLNKKVFTENQNLKISINNLLNERKHFLNTNIDQNVVISKLTIQLETQKQKNFLLFQKNQQLLTTILLNEQMNIQSKKESHLYINLYEQKIRQLRHSLSIKEMQTQMLQQKYQKLAPLPVPIDTKNIDQYTMQLLRYEKLIQELIAERNKNHYKNIQEVNSTLPEFNLQLDIKKSKEQKIPKQSFSTDIRSNISYLNSQSTNVYHDKMDVIFLRLHLQLRQLKKKYKQKVQEIAQLKCKDKTMKQGYHTLTKQMQKVRVQNCQLKIQLQHLDKKFKAGKNNSVMTKNFINLQKHSKHIFESQSSIEHKFQDFEEALKNKSLQKINSLYLQNHHNLNDDKQQYINGIQIKNKKQKLQYFENSKNQMKTQNQIKTQKDSQQVYQCDQIPADLSVSLNTSGFIGRKQFMLDQMSIF